MKCYRTVNSAEAVVVDRVGAHGHGSLEVAEAAASRPVEVASLHRRLDA